MVDLSKPYLHDLCDMGASDANFQLSPAGTYGFANRTGDRLQLVIGGGRTY